MLKKIAQPIKEMVSDFIYLVDKISRKLDLKKSGGRILLYHSIGDKDDNDHIGIRLSRQAFYEQMKYLFENKYNVVNIRYLLHLLNNNRIIPDRTVCISFDDGYEDNLTKAVPILNEFNFPATIFISTDHIGLSIRSSGYCSIQGSFLGRDDLRELLNYNIDIGLHSASHKPLTQLSISQINNEVVCSKLRLSDILGVNPDIFAYPHGVFNNDIIDVLRNNAFIGACCSIPGDNNYSTDRYKLKRTEILRDDSLFDFKKKLNGCYDWMSMFRLKDQHRYRYENIVN